MLSPEILPAGSASGKGGGRGTAINRASPSSAKQSGGRNGEKPTVAGLAKWKHLPASFLKANAVGLRDLPNSVGIPYYDATGEELFVRVRMHYQDEGDKRRFRQPKGVSPAAYGQWRLEEARLEGHLYIVEGESNCWALWCDGLPALGVPSGNWRTSFSTNTSRASGPSTSTKTRIGAARRSSRAWRPDWRPSASRATPTNCGCPRASKTLRTCTRRTPAGSK